MTRVYKAILETNTNKLIQQFSDSLVVQVNDPNKVIRIISASKYLKYSENL